MSSELLIAGAKVTVKISAQARSIRLRVDRRGGGFVLTVPRRVSTRRAIAWAQEQRGWIEDSLARRPAPVAIGPGSTLPFRGQALRIDWSADASRRIVHEGECLRVGGPIETLQPRLLRWLKAEALSLLTAETRNLAEAWGLPLTRVGIGDPVSRWGSCSSSGAIRYSWRLIMAPDFVRHSTVAHEVAHLRHMDHSPAFHAFADELLGGDHRPARSWLRREGAALQAVGRDA